MVSSHRVTANGSVSLYFPQRKVGKVGKLSNLRHIAMRDLSSHKKAEEVLGGIST